MRLMLSISVHMGPPTGNLLGIFEGDYPWKIKMETVKGKLEEETHLQTTNHHLLGSMLLF